MQQAKARKQPVVGSAPSTHQSSTRRSHVHHYITADKDVELPKMKKNREYVDTNPAGGGCFDDDDNCLSPTAWIYDGFSKFGLGTIFFYLINQAFYILTCTI